MNVATQRPLSAVDLNFNPARIPLGQLVEFAREHWGVTGEFTPLEGERDQNHRIDVRGWPELRAQGLRGRRELRARSNSRSRRCAISSATRRSCRCRA